MISFEKPYEYQKLLGFEIAEWSKDLAKVEIILQKKHGNRYGIPHGGVHASLLDTAMGFSGCFTGDPERIVRAMTLSITVNYVGQAQSEKLIAWGRKIGGGKRTFFAEGRVEDDLGTLIATASGTFRYRG